MVARRVTTHLVIPDSHAHPNHPNDRADWLSQLILDSRPDVVVHIGDSADMPSLSDYDKGKRSFHGRTYRADVDAHLDFQDRLWGPVVRRKKRLPRSVFCIGNHERRIEKALDVNPTLVNTIGMGDLELQRWYRDVVPYDGQTPGIIAIDGIFYSHFFVTGVSGRPTTGEHSGYSLLTKHFASCTAGHSHLLDFCTRPTLAGNRIHGLVAGCYQDYDSDWAGDSNRLWWRGVVLKKNVHEGSYDPEFISIDQLRKEYG